MCQSSSVRPVACLLTWRVGGGTQHLRSWPWPHMSSRDCALLATHHVVHECQPITFFFGLRPSKMFLTADLLLTAEASLGNACGADCGAAAAFEKEEISIFTLSLIFLYFRSSFQLRYVMLATSSSLSFTPLTLSRWYVMRISSPYYFHVFLLNSLCNFPRVKSTFRGLLLC